MKQYFTKIISANRAINNKPDGCYCDEDQGAGYTYNDEHGSCNVCLEQKSIGKMSLCSRDIQVGDKVQDEEGTEAIVESISEAGLIRLRIGKEFYTDVIESFYKIIGEISPEATWVKEGQEFDENEFRFIAHFGLNKSECQIIIDYNTFSMGRDAWSPLDAENYLYKNIQIKCPHCGTFQ